LQRKSMYVVYLRCIIDEPRFCGLQWVDLTGSVSKFKVLVLL
jgi:hypothetical protein